MPRPGRPSKRSKAALPVTWIVSGLTYQRLKVPGANMFWTPCKVCTIDIIVCVPFLWGEATGTGWKKKYYSSVQFLLVTVWRRVGRGWRYRSWGAGTVLFFPGDSFCLCADVSQGSVLCLLSLLCLPFSWSWWESLSFKLIQVLTFFPELSWPLIMHHGSVLAHRHSSASSRHSTSIFSNRWSCL